MSRFITIALLAISAFAAPQFRGPKPGAKCDPTKAKLTVTAGLPVPAGPTSQVLLGVGVQNYTCSAAGTYAAAGAVAELFDISCLVGTPLFDNVQDVAMTAWNHTGERRCNKSVIGAIKGVTAAGDHFFSTSPSGTGISPVWDQRNLPPKNPDAFILGAKAAGVHAPTGPQDVDWLQISNVQGKLATTVYRADTRGGPPPASCVPGSAPVSVKYTAKYWLY